jgi:hypothetical protein
MWKAPSAQEVADEVSQCLASGDEALARRLILSVAVASPRYLLAMKLLASRADRDIDDIKFLYQLCGLSTAEEGAELLQSYYPTRRAFTRPGYRTRALSPLQMTL